MKNSTYSLPSRATENVVVIISDCYKREYLPNIEDDVLSGRHLIDFAVDKALSITGENNVFLSTYARERLELLANRNIQASIVKKEPSTESVFLPPEMEGIMADNFFTKYSKDTRLIILSTLCPFIERGIILKALSMSLNDQLGTVATLSPVRDHPSLAMTKAADGSLKRFYGNGYRFFRRQEFPPVYEPTNAVNICKKSKWSEFDIHLLSGEALGFFTQGLDAFMVETRLELLLARKIEKTRQTHKLKTNTDFDLYMKSNFGLI